MPEKFTYNIEKAQEEAEKMKAKVESDEVRDYAEAEKLIEKLNFEPENPFIEKILDEDELEDGYKTIDTPVSRSGGYHFIMETESGKKFVEKYPEEAKDGNYQKIYETVDFINEYFESNLIKYAIAIGILDEKKFKVPSIKIDPKIEGAYFSEFIPNVVNGSRGGDIFGALSTINNLPREIVEKLPYEQYINLEKQYSNYIHAFWNEFGKKENSMPLAIIHLIAGDLDRNMSNYGFQISKSKEGKINFNIVILDMAGGWGENRQRKGIIGSVLLKSFSKEEVIQYWEKIKVYFSEDVITKIFNNIPFDNELKNKRKIEIFDNIKNVEKLIEEELKNI